MVPMKKKQKKSTWKNIFLAWAVVILSGLSKQYFQQETKQ